MYEQKQSQPSPSTAGSGPIRCDNIFEAIRFDSPSEFKRLIEAKEDLAHTEGGNGVSALEYAAGCGRASIVDMILKRRKIPRELNQALLRAAAFDNVAVVKSLLQARANVSRTDYWGRSPLNVAANAGHASVVQILIKANASFADKDGADWTPLQSAAFAGHTDVVNTLIKAKCDLDVVYNESQTALSLAASKGHTNVVKNLLAAKAAFISLEDLLLGLAEANHVSVLQVLLEAGVDVDYPLWFGGTMLHTAVIKRNVSFVYALIKARASFDARDNQSLTPLHLAAQQDRPHENVINGNG